MEEGVLWRRVCYCPGILTKCYLDQKHLVRSTFHVSLSFPEADFGVTGLDSGDPSECPWLPGGVVCILQTFSGALKTHSLWTRREQRD